MFLIDFLRLATHLLRTPTEENVLVVGSCIVRDLALETPATKVYFIPRTRVESYLKLLTMDKRRYIKTVINIGSDYTWARQLQAEKRVRLQFCVYVLL